MKDTKSKKRSVSALDNREEQTSSQVDTETSLNDGPLEFHEIANMFPLMTSEELKELEDDIKTRGLRDKIRTYQGKILDGRNRYMACMKIGVELDLREFTGSDPIGFVISKNFHRRHLNSGQRAAIAADIVTLRRGDVATQTGVSKETPCPAEKAAKSMNVSRAQFFRARKLKSTADTETFEAVKEGKLSIGKAQRKTDRRRQMQNLSETTPEAVSDNPVEAEGPPSVDADTSNGCLKQALRAMKKIPASAPGRKAAFAALLVFIRENYSDTELTESAALDS